ncbi:MAG: Fe-S cluster assembly sulfur transfer protein SufU [Chloracidobacterium sp.]|uniref:SUF system NifU family Fe-S cluster assembly protein n=1 Tax=Chloracidobacterium validum TaxID=2821543 RepID=A0ABX8BEQ7_9BACT|nr:SUF system NifU family Fe-S cluster assembly protein [Chloracidobacterium validum]QUW04491.1 SUF system NifU family Fe-S cluster assembly protein [Chloracidobacterium validum]
MSNTSLYGEQIIYLSKHPKNFRPIENAHYLCEGANPLCGDRVTVYVNVGADDTLEDVAFQGSGCAICMASASMMTTSLKGKKRAEAEQLFDEFHRLVKGELDPQREAHHLGKLTMFENVSHYPVRVKCASLPWHALHNALNHQSAASTE